MTTSKTDLEGSIQEHDEQIDKKVTQEGQNTKDYVQTHRLSTLESHSCSRTTTFFGSFRIHFSAQSF